MSTPTITQPDQAEFDRDMAAMARAERWLFGRALWGEEGQRPTMPDDDLLCDFIPGCEVELFLVTDDKVTELIGDDLAEWSKQIAATTERLVAEVFHATAVA
jgi:hypothetical protein